jgi:hypothetical protein
MADVKTEEIEALGEMADVRFGHHGLSVRRTKDCHISGKGMAQRW